FKDRFANFAPAVQLPAGSALLRLQQRNEIMQTIERFVNKFFYFT
ncbi:hypothetical protein F4827_006865, partial [Paraburkholderia bannensis]|nr:hypothetical protein [Paraburkholderia sp. WP4_3_2]MBB6106985.1 hypothetical protein [Paraburkholderia bannensis]